MRCWHVCPKWEVALGAAAKCGSTMLAKLVADNDAVQASDPRQVRVGWSDVPRTMRKVAIVRHPVDRFASLYANIQQRPRSRNNYYAQFEGLSPGEVLDRIVGDLTREFHYQPQTLCLGPSVHGLVRLESFGRWFAHNFPQAKAPKHLNESERVELDDRTAERVMRIYENDFELWADAYAGQ